MNAKKAFNLVLGLLALAFFEGVVKNYLSGFPVTEVLAFQSAAVAYILGTKTINDVNEMKNGITMEKLKMGCK